MGSCDGESSDRSPEYPQHKVSISPFFMSRYLITQAQWRAVASLPQVHHPLLLNPSKFKGNDCPVEQISFEDALEFCLRLGRKSARRYRLPSESEWEYACRAGSSTPFHFGDILIPELANCKKFSEVTDRVKKDSHRKTTPVGSFMVANAFGLYDMHGDVWEWCMDHWHSSYKQAPTDGKAWLRKKSNQLRVIRGGSWSDLENCRSACRKSHDQKKNGSYLGFRVACFI